MVTAFLECLPMLTSRLIHPPLLRALAAAGHNSKVLLADANYPHSTGIGPRTELIHLNLSPGLVGVLDVLDAVLSVVPVERAAVMRPDEGGQPAILERFTQALGPDKSIVPLPRSEFYETCRGDDVAVAVATGEQMFYANLLLTIGSVAPPAGAG